MSGTLGAPCLTSFVSSSMRAPQIQSADRLSALIFADRISADERGLAFPSSGFWGSALAGGNWHYGRRMCGVPEKPTANKAGAGNGAGTLLFHMSDGMGAPCLT
jgi:hypothetical protein